MAPRSPRPSAGRATRTSARGLPLEQTGDSAKAAAEADPGLGTAAREAVLAAHLAICILKPEV